MPGKIFISYSHDSDEHRDKVLALSERLRAEGLYAWLDRYVGGSPEEGWPRWMLDELDEADFVLVVCTETYYRRFRGHEVPGKGEGADWEGARITQEMYEAKSRTNKFVAVLLSAGQEDFIPEPLRGRTFYTLTSEKDYQKLYAFLRGQAHVQPCPLGDLKQIPKRDVPPLAFLPTPEPTPRMIGVPHRNTYFTGREPLLADLHQRLQTGDVTALAQAVLRGAGGIGKTATAIEYVHRFRKHYQVVLWAVADQELRARYLSIARELKLVDERDNIETAVREVKAWLSREEGWLLVFDGADEPALVRDFLPVARAEGKVLLTSRATIFDDVGIGKPFPVEKMTHDDAVMFLLKRTNREKAGVDDLVEKLDCLPLALAQAAAYIGTVGRSFNAYLTSFEQRGMELLEKYGPGAGYEKTVATTWNLSLTNVKKSSPASAELLTVAAFLVPDSVPAEIFIQGGSKLGIQLARKLKAADKDGCFLELLPPLESYSLVELLPGDPDPRAFQMQRLMQEVIKASMTRKGRQAKAEQVIRALDAVYPPPDQKNWKICEKLQPHVRKAYDLARDYELESPEAGRLFHEAGLFAWEYGDYATARLFETLALTILEKALGLQNRDTLISRQILALALRSLGELTEARKLNQQTLDIYKPVLSGLLAKGAGTLTADTLEMMDKLAYAHWAVDEYEESRKLHQQTLDGRRDVLGAKHRDTLHSMNNLAETLRCLNDLTGARERHEETLEGRREALSDKDPDTLRSMNNLAETLRCLDDLTGARKRHEETLTIQERVLPPDHPDTLLSIHNLARILHRQGEWQVARDYMARAVEGRRRKLGERHPDTQLSIESLRQFQEAMEHREATPGIAGAF